jgi:hypothetical protein
MDPDNAKTLEERQMDQFVGVFSDWAGSICDRLETDEPFRRIMAGAWLSKMADLAARALETGCERLQRRRGSVVFPCAPDRLARSSFNCYADHFTHLQ